MISVVDPNGSPGPVYNRPGVSLQNIAANGVTYGTATQIVSPTGWAIVIATADDSPLNRGVILPEDAQICDCVEIYFSGYNGLIFPFSGETINGSSSEFGLAGGSGALFRKVSSTAWRLIHYASA